jgi:hypothetical protein
MFPGKTGPPEPTAAKAPDRRDAERLQQGAAREVVVLVACESRQGEHDDEMHTALVQAAIHEQALELAAVRGLGTLALFVEAFENLAALTAAVLFARVELRWQTEVLGLLLRADANEDHRADHRRQLRSIRGRVQGTFPRHGFYSGIRACSDAEHSSILLMVMADFWRE